jgi:hypothetical protein
MTAAFMWLTIIHSIFQIVVAPSVTFSFSWFLAQAVVDLHLSLPLIQEQWGRLWQEVNNPTLIEVKRSKAWGKIIVVR